MHTIAMLLLVSPIAIAEPAYAQCDAMQSGSRTSVHGTHIDSDEDGTSSHIRYTQSDGSRCTSATIIGRLKYSDAEDDVVDVPFGGLAVFRERTSNDDRELTITRVQSGGLLRLYRRNGVASEYDSDARRWLAGFLPVVLMDAGINVAPRVARWRSQGGVDNVLAHIGTMNSSGAKRAHYEQLMTGERLSDTDLDKVVRHAGRNIQSSGDLRAVLERAAPSQGGGMRSASALEEAVMHIASSGDRTAVLERYGQTSDREMLLSVMRAARTIPSSGDKSNLLEQLAARYLSNNDRDLNTAFFQAAMTVQSSGDLRNVLDSAMPYVGKSGDQALMLIEASRSIASSGDRSEVLISLVNTGVVTTSRVRDAFLDAAGSVASNGDRSRVLEAAGRRQ
jgi:hypothetical protein